MVTLMAGRKERRDGVLVVSVPSATLSKRGVVPLMAEGYL